MRFIRFYPVFLEEFAIANLDAYKLRHSLKSAVGCKNVPMLMRDARSDDSVHLFQLAKEASTAGHWPEKTYATLLHTRSVLVAEENGSILGMIVAHDVAGEWEIENIAVTASSRRKGIAAELLQAMIGRTRQTMASAIYLEVRASNTAAIHLYRKFAFVQTGQRKGYYSSPTEDALL